MLVRRVMKIFKFMRDGGPESRVTGFFLVEAKKLFSVALMHFADGSRDAYHNHAFNALSWVFKGNLVENMVEGKVNVYKPSLKPIYTSREHFHKVMSQGNTWVLTFRGPWRDKWNEFIPAKNTFLTLTHGREVLGEIHVGRKY
jgi:hypothetical protein